MGLLQALHNGMSSVAVSSKSVTTRENTRPTRNRCLWHMSLSQRAVEHIADHPHGRRHRGEAEVKQEGNHLIGLR